MKKLFALVLAVAVIACFESSAPSPLPSNSQSGSCSAQGTGNTVNCAPATPSPSATPVGGVCVPQTAPYVCFNGSLVYGAILESVQKNVAPAPEPIYVANLVKALNADPNICAQAGPTSDEVTIKARVSNAQSETWDVVRADGAIQAIPAAPLPVCQPSRF